MFVYRKVVFEKSLSKLSCVYLPLGKLVNRKHFPVKKNLVWFSGKCFPFWPCLFSEKTFMCLFAIRKVGQRKTLSSQRKIWFGFQESAFPFGRVCFPKSGFRETTFQTFLYLFAIRKVD